MIFGIPLAFWFIVVGVKKTSQFIIWFFQRKQSYEWQKTHGRIIQSNLQSVRVPRGGRKSYNFDGSLRLITAYTPEILYEYRANTESFQSNQIFLGQFFPTNLVTASNFVEQYPVGKEIIVYFNPEKPESAILERGRFKELLGYLIGGIIYLLYGFAILIQVIHE